MARIIRDTQVRSDRDLRTALPLGKARALRARDVSRLVKIDGVTPAPNVGRLMSFITAPFRRLRGLFA